MNPAYSHPDRRGRVTHAYRCEGEYAVGGAFCMSVPGGQLDDGIRRAVFERLTAPRLELVRQAWRERQRDEQGEAQRRRAELDRARREEDAAPQRCLLVDPQNRRVAAEYQEMWEDAKRRLEQLEAGNGAATTAQSLMDEKLSDEVVRLCADIGAIWDAPTTANRDRKEIVRTMIEAVIIEDRTREHIRACVVWADAHPDTEVEVKLTPFIHKLIAQYAAGGVSPGEIAERLNGAGYRTLQGNPWSVPTVRSLIGRWRLLGEGFRQSA